jgi:hypothetical protein
MIWYLLSLRNGVCLTVTVTPACQIGRLRYVCENSTVVESNNCFCLENLYCTSCFAGSSKETFWSIFFNVFSGTLKIFATFCK